MALFKILRGSKENLINKSVANTQYIHDGYCYFTPEDGKFYIDVAKDITSTQETPIIGDNRIVLNAEKADQLANKRTITLSGDVTGSIAFDGSSDITLNTTIVDGSHNHSATDITSGTLAVARGGTGQTTVANAINALLNGIVGTLSATAIADDDKFYVHDTSANGKKSITATNVATYVLNKLELDAFTEADIDEICGSVILNAAEGVW